MVNKINKPIKKYSNLKQVIKIDDITQIRLFNGVLSYWITDTCVFSIDDPKRFLNNISSILDSNIIL